ncbi:MAG: hypothetical protein KJ573_17285 [Proteobacteria bacterium]|jgi:hypothetical protein|nr:hypothetical protein [Desulfobacterales bacterium]MBL6967761.1 hypothetical protein [Desulfobacteraceae bacterium]MBU0734348.1 hypothetical protein [Pseudomonadota bacterium]MBL7101342.1 hypothetical protein [Desulfobacteraceae bacterium]MBU0989682.1 hypothetical protein [Pseudomonadota bacterium]
MNIHEAIMAFSQSEKVKSGIIWVSQALELLGGLPTHEKQGAEKIIRMKVDMIVQEIRLARNVTGDAAWDNIEPIIDQAIVMINSGVAPDSVVHLTQALSRVTSIGHSSMSFLKEKGLL